MNYSLNKSKIFFKRRWIQEGSKINVYRQDVKWKWNEISNRKAHAHTVFTRRIARNTFEICISKRIIISWNLYTLDIHTQRLCYVNTWILLFAIFIYFTLFYNVFKNICFFWRFLLVFIFYFAIMSFWITYENE